jgi:alpha-D-ribose 1-methylphosphonate 5-triphosphate synthase subunit PhnG
VIDGALQDGERLDLRTELVDRLAARQRVAREDVAAKAAATRVQFFTMATMR